MVIFDGAIVIAADVSQLGSAFGAHERPALKEFVLNIDIAAGEAMDRRLQFDIERVAVGADIDEAQMRRMAEFAFALPVDQSGRFQQFGIGQALQPFKRPESILTERLQQRIAVIARMLPFMSRKQDEIGPQP